MIDLLEKVFLRISSLFFLFVKFGYFFRCIVENFFGYDDVVFFVFRVGKFIKIDINFIVFEFLISSFFLFCVLYVRFF